MDMGFWIFMFIMNLLCPLIMVCFGAYFSKTAPKNISYFYGYRTSMSMINMDTWNFAHHYFGKIWLKVGAFLLPLSVIFSLLLLGKDDDAIGMFSLIIVTVQMIALIIPIYFTEKALKANFDEFGHKK